MNRMRAVLAVALILAGGAGTRLRPLSSDENPKQFLRIFDGCSLLEKTFARVRRSVASVYISTSEQYAEKCAQQLGIVNILTEPSRRNNAPAITLCCHEIEAREGDVVIAVLPSDHFIRDEAEFGRVLDRAFEFAEANDYLVTIGIEATEPNTAYGYLHLGDELEPGVIAVQRFLEKPSRERAEEFMRRGNYAWNAGIFVWRASVFRSEIAHAGGEASEPDDLSYRLRWCDGVQRLKSATDQLGVRQARSLSQAPQDGLAAFVEPRLHDFAHGSLMSYRLYDVRQPASTEGPKWPRRIV